MHHRLSLVALIVLLATKQRDTVQGQLSALIAAFSYEG